MSVPVDPDGTTADGAGPSGSAPSARRDDLDLFKAALVAGMVLTHVLQLLRPSLGSIETRIAEYGNLVSFAGFLFAFGLGSALSGRRGPWIRGGWRRWRGPVRLFAALWASSLAFALLVEQRPLEVDWLLRLVIGTELFGWSEFLASFAILALVLTLAGPRLVGLLAQPAALPIAVVLAGLSTLSLSALGFGTGGVVPYLAAIVPVGGVVSFPLIAYGPWFVLGVQVAVRGLDLRWFLPPAVVLTALYYLPVAGDQARVRFPPEPLWLAGGAGFVIALALLTRAVCAIVTVPRLLLLPGQHVLTFLVVSNVLIFGLRRLEGPWLTGPLAAGGVAIAVLVAATAAALVVRRSGRGSVLSTNR